MKRSEILFGLTKIPLDGLACLSALVLAYILRTKQIDLLPAIQLLLEPSALPPLPYYLTHFTLPATFVFIAISSLLGLYSLQITRGPWKEVGGVLFASIIWVGMIMGWYFLVQKQLFFSRILLVQATVFTTIFVVVGRSLVTIIQRVLLRRGIGQRTVLYCGPLPMPILVQEALEKDERYAVIESKEIAEEVVQKCKYQPIDFILHVDSNSTSTETLHLAEFARSHHIEYACIPTVFLSTPHLLRLEFIGLQPILRLVPTPLDGWGRVAKRIIDIMTALILLLVLSPLFVIISLCILLASGKPIFYRSRRIGQYGKSEIPLLKFRTMIQNADELKHTMHHLSHRSDGPLFKIKNDPRVYPFGRLLRRYSLDELPQLFNVLSGHISLVGPRPHLSEEVAKYKDDDRRVLSVRPGITGLSQISGRSNLSFEEEIQLDTRYIEEWSILFDLWIIWRTIFVVLAGKGAD